VVVGGGRSLRGAATSDNAAGMERFLSLFAARFASVRTGRPSRPSRFLPDRRAPRETLIERTRWRRTSLRALSITRLNGSLKYILSI